MNDNLRISVIVPVYNLEKYIGKCIESLVTQNYVNFEVILIDDGSTDGSRAVLENWCVRYPDTVKAFYIDNSGVSNARNFGLNYVTGDFVVFVDGDDYVEKDYLEKLVEPFSDSLVDLSVVDYYIENGSCKKTYSDMSETTVLLNREQAMISACKNEGIAGYVWNKCFRVETIKKRNLRFNPEVKIMEDFLFTIEYMNFCDKVAYTKRPLYNYFIRSSSAMGGKDSIRNPSQLIALKKIYCVSKCFHDSFESVIAERYANVYIAIYYSGNLNHDEYKKKRTKEIANEIANIGGILSGKHKMMLWIMIFFPSVAAAIARCRVKH